MNNVPARACTKCGKVKPLTEFYRSNRSNRADKLESSCKVCKNIQRNQWAAKNAEAVKRIYQRRFQSPKGRRVHSRSQVKRKFGIPLEQYEQMLVDQRGLCFICHQPNPTNIPIGLDHNHDTGAVRAFLCAACNLGIRHFKENPELIRKAIQYLNKCNEQ